VAGLHVRHLLVEFSPNQCASGQEVHRRLFEFFGTSRWSVGVTQTKKKSFLASGSDDGPSMEDTIDTMCHILGVSAPCTCSVHSPAGLQTWYFFQLTLFLEYLYKLSFLVGLSVIRHCVRVFIYMGLNISATAQVNCTGSASILCPVAAPYCRTRLQITPAAAYQTGAIWSNTPVDVSKVCSLNMICLIALNDCGSMGT
jgi:hypothetical protein